MCLQATAPCAASILLSDSVLIESQCQQTKDWSHLVFWTYLAIRSAADIFPTTAVALIDAAVVIATRETSCGRGDVGRQLAFGSLGFAIFGPPNRLPLYSRREPELVLLSATWYARCDDAPGSCGCNLR